MASQQQDLAAPQPATRWPREAGTLFAPSARPPFATPSRQAEVALRDPLLPETDEMFRSIYTRAGIGFASEAVAVCSAIAGEGKTAISLGLAVTIARDFPERKILLIETDVQLPILAHDFDIEPTPGLVDCLADRQPMETACRPSSLDNLDLLPAGGPVAGHGRLMRSANMAVAIDDLRKLYDLIIIDTPALLVNSDALVLTDLADGVILVVGAGATPSALVTRALEQIDDNKLRGVVLNNARAAAPGWLRRLIGL